MRRFGNGFKFKIDAKWLPIIHCFLSYCRNREHHNIEYEWFQSPSCCVDCFPKLDLSNRDIPFRKMVLVASRRVAFYCNNLRFLYAQLSLGRICNQPRVCQLGCCAHLDNLFGPNLGSNHIRGCKERRAEIELFITSF